MGTEWLPWTDYPGLTYQRLLTVASIIRVARGGAADDHHPEVFETNWSLGVRAYERTCGSLAWESQHHPWLTVVAGSGGGPVHFVMTIGGHPVRFYRGEPDDVPFRYQQTSIPEVVELQKALALDGHLPKGRCLRIAITNGSTGHPASIFLVEMDEETAHVVNSWCIPELAATTTVTDFAQPSPPADLPPVVAEALEDGQQALDNQGTKEATKKTGS